MLARRSFNWRILWRKDRVVSGKQFYELTAFRHFVSRSVSNMPQYKLIYFDYQGFAEPIRLALSHAGVPFEDIRHKYEFGWQSKIPSLLGRLPVLEVDGKALPESMAILRYIGEQHGLQASNPWDRAMGDALASAWVDLHPLFDACDFTTGKWDVPKVEKFVEATVKPRLKHIDAFLAQRKTAFLTSDNATWADFYTYTFLAMLKVAFRVPLESYPQVVQFYKKIEDLPAVKSWHQSHPNDSWGGDFKGPYG